MWDPYAEFESTILPNGLTIYATHWQGRPWQAMGFVIHSGAEQDPIGLEGLAHFTEHAVTNNANISFTAINEFFNDQGGKVRLGTTGFAFTKWDFFLPLDKKLLSKTFSIFGHMLLMEKIEKFIERERQIIIGEFDRSFTTKVALDLAWKRQKALFTGTFLERFVNPVGTPESIKRINQNEF